ncbi:MAG: DUF354 domain-containing protein [Bacteroidia bacterium]|nr:DUF354 domain-containing protein [Bacteroidia bacterium]
MMQKKKKYLFYLAHPAHFHLFRNCMRLLTDHGHTVLVTIKTKDVLSRLLQESGMDYINVAEQERNDSRWGIARAFISRVLRHWKIARRFKPDVFISTSAEFAPFAKLLGIKTISVFEDDLDIFPMYSNTFVRFLDHQLCPESCSAARWEHHPKTIKYRGNQELAYLRPAYFQPDYTKVKDLFSGNRLNFFIRFAKLTAWHDENKTGITDKLALEIIRLLEPYGRVHLSSERALPPELEKYKVNVKASDILHVLYFADLYLGDSQTMTAEAAVLGTPAVRFNDFVGKLGYLEELEHRYGLTYGIPTGEAETLLEKLNELIQTPDLKAAWKLKRDKLLRETIDPTRFFAWFFGNYPESAAALKANPHLQNQFFDHAA